MKKKIGTVVGFILSLIGGIFLIYIGFLTAIRQVGPRTFVLEGILIALAGIAILIGGSLMRSNRQKIGGWLSLGVGIAYLFYFLVATKFELSALYFSWPALLAIIGGIFGILAK